MKNRSERERERDEFGLTEFFEGSLILFLPEVIELRFGSIDEDRRTILKDLLRCSFHGNEISFVLIVRRMNGELIAIR